MSGYQVVGLLDRPSTESLGIVGLVVEREDGRFFTEGVVDSAERPIDAGEFTELLVAGDAQQVTGPEIEDASRKYAALWVGYEFAEKAERLNIRLPPLPKSTQTKDSHGNYWVAPTRHVWRVIDSWLVQAFRRSILEKNAELAALMAWALPEREETRAALWQNCTDKQRESNLIWWARLEQDHGHSSVTPKTLNARFTELVNELDLQPRRRVYGFCARAKGGDNDIATLLSRELSRDMPTPRFSFGKWLGAKAEKEGKKPTR
jgi:hypothetical protein